MNSTVDENEEEGGGGVCEMGRMRRPRSPLCGEAGRRYFRMKLYLIDLHIRRSSFAHTCSSSSGQNGKLENAVKRAVNGVRLHPCMFDALTTRLDLIHDSARSHPLI